jgi:hypothetical protein
MRVNNAASTSPRAVDLKEENATSRIGTRKRRLSALRTAGSLSAGLEGRILTADPFRQTSIATEQRIARVSM